MLMLTNCCDFFFKKQSRNVGIHFLNHDHDNGQMLEKFSAEIANVHSWSIIIPYLGWNITQHEDVALYKLCRRFIAPYDKLENLL